LTTLVEDARLRRVMGDAARAVARVRFHPDAVARRTRDVYVEAMDGHEITAPMPVRPAMAS
jgi:hypothetical protein